MLGRTLVQNLEEYQLLPVDIQEMDILEEVEINRVFSQFRPDVVVHCAAMTDVDGCEKSPHLAMALNGTATGKHRQSQPEIWHQDDSHLHRLCFRWPSGAALSGDRPHRPGHCLWQE